MNILKQVFHLFRSGASTQGYYRAMNDALKRISGEYTMLHYPYYEKDSDTFYESQVNLTDFCLSKLDSLENKHVLEVGCGNGVQTNYILSRHQPACITGIDLSRANICIANREKQRREVKKAFFLVDDAQAMKKIEDSFFDVVINIESAFHYPDKAAFLKEIHRVLKPGGQFLIADILTTRMRNREHGTRWKRKMVLHHWSLDTYLEKIHDSNLSLTAREDITHKVIKGFRNYRNYFRNMKQQGFINDLVFRFFYWVNIQLNIYLLRKKRYYYVFSGIKPAVVLSR